MLYVSFNKNIINNFGNKRKYCVTQLLLNLGVSLDGTQQDFKNYVAINYRPLDPPLKSFSLLEATPDSIEYPIWDNF